MQGWDGIGLEYSIESSIYLSRRFGIYKYLHSLVERLPQHSTILDHGHSLQLLQTRYVSRFIRLLSKLVVFTPIRCLSHSALFSDHCRPCRPRLTSLLAYQQILKQLDSLGSVVEPVQNFKSVQTGMAVYGRPLWSGCVNYRTPYVSFSQGLLMAAPTRSSYAKPTRVKSNGTLSKSTQFILSRRSVFPFCHGDLQRLKYPQDHRHRPTWNVLGFRLFSDLQSSPDENRSQLK